MACTKATPMVWVAIVAVFAVVVVQNGRLCMAFELSDVKDSVSNSAEEAKNGAESLFGKVVGYCIWRLGFTQCTPERRLSLDPLDMKQGAEDMMHKANDNSDAEAFAGAKLHSISHISLPGVENVEKYYDEAKNDVGGAYDSTAKNIMHED